MSKDKELQLWQRNLSVLRAKQICLSALLNNITRAGANDYFCPSVGPMCKASADEIIKLSREIGSIFPAEIPTEGTGGNAGVAA